MTAAGGKIPVRMARHREMLGVACLIIVLSFLLEVRAEGRVAIAGLSHYPLPHACLSWSWFGVKCPGCGLTRSFIYLAHGDLQKSLSVHRVGWILAAAVLVQVPYRALSLLRPDKEFLGKRLRVGFGFALIALLIGNWLFDLVWTAARL